MLNEFKNFNIDFFERILDVINEKRVECTHQDIKEKEKRYQCQWNISMIADYCRNLHSDTVKSLHKRKKYKKSIFTIRKKPLTKKMYV